MSGKFEAFLIALSARFGVDPELIWPPSVSSAPLYVSVYVGALCIIIFGFAFQSHPEEAQKQKKIDKEYKISSLQNLLDAEKELKEKAEDGKNDDKAADAQKLHDLLYDDVAGEPVTCLGISPDHPAFTETVALLKTRINEELKEATEKTKIARGLIKTEEKDVDEEENEDYMDGNKLSDFLELCGKVTKNFVKVDASMVDKAALKEAKALLKQIRAARSELTKQIFRIFIPILPTYITGVLINVVVGTAWGFVWNYRAQINAYAAGEGLDIDVAYSMLTAYFVMSNLIEPISNVTSLMIQKASAQFELQLRCVVLQSLLCQDRVYFDRHDVGALQMKLSGDVSAVSNNLLSLPSQMLSNVVDLVVKLSLVYSISPDLALWCGIINVPISAVISMASLSMLRQQSQKIDRVEQQGASLTTELLKEMVTVKMFATEEQEHKKYETNSAVSNVMQMAMSAIQNLAWMVFCAVNTFGKVFNMYYCIRLRVEGKMTGSEMVVTGMALDTLQWTIQSLIRMVPKLAKLAEPVQRVAALLDSTPKIEKSPTSTEEKLKPAKFRGEIEFKDVCFTYPTERQKQVLFGLSFTASPGQKVAFVGKAGCGKSTSVGLIQRFYDISSGSITLDGKPLDAYDTRHLRRHIGVVAQDNVLFAKTIRENVCYGMDGDVPIEDVWAAVEKANAREFVETFPDKLETRVGEKGAKLSGGQKQRIAIARAMIRKPTILLLDEATSALDSINEKEVQRSLDTMVKEHAGVCIVIAHRLSTIRNCDKIIVMDGGKKMEEGTHDALIKQPIKRDADAKVIPGPGLYHEMWDTQTGEESSHEGANGMTRSQLEGQVERLRGELAKYERQLEVKAKASRAKTKLKSAVKFMLMNKALKAEAAAADGEEKGDPAQQTSGGGGAAVGEGEGAESDGSEQADGIELLRERSAMEGVSGEDANLASIGSACLRSRSSSSFRSAGSSAHAR